MGPSAQDIISGLDAVRKSLCAYGPDSNFCDCKFVGNGKLGGAGGEATGCAEIRSAIRILESASTANLRELQARVGTAESRLREIAALTEGLV